MCTSSALRHTHRGHPFAYQYGARGAAQYHLTTLATNTLQRNTICAFLLNDFLVISKSNKWTYVCIRYGYKYTIFLISFLTKSGHKSQGAAIKQTNPSKTVSAPCPRPRLHCCGQKVWISPGTLRAFSDWYDSRLTQQTTRQWKPKWKWKRKWEAREMDNKIIKWNVLFFIFIIPSIECLLVLLLLLFVFYDNLQVSFVLLFYASVLCGCVSWE